MNQELEKLLKHCTVKILSGSSGWGTGFFVAPGLVLTCAHVLKNAANHPVQVLYPEQGQGYLAALESEAEFDYIDVALLRLQEPVLKHPCVYLDESVQLNDLLCSYGYPDDFTTGSFATFHSEALTGGNSFIKFKAGQVRSGMSGSPLLNQRTGKVCGMVKFTRDRSTDLGGGAVPTALILAQFPQLRAYQREFHQQNCYWANLLPISIPQGFELDHRQRVSWQEVCRKMLEDRSSLTSNRLLPIGMDRDLLKDDIFVDLALVQQKKADKRGGDVLPEQGSQLYEPTGYAEIERFEFSRFLTEILGSKKSDRLAIIGEPGSGKTTFLQKIAFWLLANSEDLVIWVSLGELRGKDLRDYLTEDWLQQAKMYADPSIREDWERQFNQRSVWLLLDGLDEMTVDARDDLVIRGWVTQARILISCRLNVWQAKPSILNGFETYRMLEFQLHQMEQFIQKWFHNDAASGQNLQRALNQSGKERIRDLVRNPLRLTLLCSAWHSRDGKLPNTKAELYQQFVDDLYEWKNKHFPTTSNQRKQLNEKLGELAKEAIDKEFTRFRLRHHLVCEVLGKPDEPESMLGLALNLGWLNIVGLDADNPRYPVYAFFHATFQEYFAAKAIDDWDFFLPREHENEPVKSQENSRRYRIFEPQWKEVILLWLGQNRKDLEEQKIAFIEALENFDDGCKFFYGYRALFLAAAGIAEVNSHHPRADEILRRITVWSFGYFNKEEKRWITFLEPIEENARLALLETDRQKAIREIHSLLEVVEDKFIRYEAADFLGELDRKNEQAISTLLELLRNTEEEWLKLRTAGSLVQIDYLETEVEEALLAILKKSEFEIYQRDAAYYLRQINSNHPQAIKTLLELFSNSKDERFRRSLDIEEIGKDNLEVVKTLLKVFFAGQDIVHRRQAGDCLGAILAEQFNILDSLLSLIRVQKSILSQFNVVAKQEELGILYLKNTLMLIDLSLTTQDKKLRRQSLWNLVKMGVDHPEMAKAFFETFVSRGDERRKTILKCTQVFHLKTSELISVGNECLDLVEDDWLRISIATGINRVDPSNPKAVAALKDILNSCKREMERRWIAYNMKEIESEISTAIEILLDLLKTAQNWDIARWSAQDLGEIGNNNLEIVQSLLDLLISTSERRVATSIIYGLKKVFTPTALTLVFTTAKDYLNSELRENNPRLYSNAFEILWHCASRMPYVDFYTLWNGEVNEESPQQESV